MSEIPEELRVMGDALERAWQKDVGARTLPARRILIGVVAAVMLLGAGAAIANSVLKSNADEEAGSWAATTCSRAPRRRASRARRRRSTARWIEPRRV
jgi:hypothetical protein